jgi:hypothetical protein
MPVVATGLTGQLALTSNDETTPTAIGKSLGSRNVQVQFEHDIRASATQRPFPLDRAVSRFSTGPSFMKRRLRRIRCAGPIEIDRERDEGVYVEPNVWMVHPP